MIVLGILFPLNSPVALGALCAIFLAAVFKALSPATEGYPIYIFCNF